MSSAVSALGHLVLSAIAALGEMALLGLNTLGKAMRALALGKWRYRESLEQLYSVGVQSLPVVALCIGFVSLMLITEFSFHMKLVLRQDSLVPAFSTVLLVRELGPVVTSLLLACRVGAGMATEIALMKSTEQLDALALMGIDRVEYLAVPRWFAATVGAVFLMLIAIAVAIGGAAYLAAPQLGYSAGEFLNTMFIFVKEADFLGATVKAALFGSVFSLVAIRQGFQAEPGSRGVGSAATRAVVHGSVLIITVDFVLTYFLYALY